MTLFLTSHIGGSVRVNGKRSPAELITANHLADAIKERWPENADVLFIAADPNDVEKVASYKNAYLYAFPLHGMSIHSYTICDATNMAVVDRLAQYDVIILSGGHVPTQNAFFQSINLKEKIRDFSGIIIGISAGTMNCAKTVYAHPELDGEVIDPQYKRFIPGLGLTKRMILPHYQMIKDEVLDNLRAMEDIAYPDSIGREFYALCDGSYILSENGKEILHGEAYLIKNGQLVKICETDQTLVL